MDFCHICQILTGRTPAMLLPICAALLMMASCSTVSVPQPNPAQGLKIGDIVETATGKTITMDALIDDLCRASIVYVGEMHTSVQDHQVQLKVLQNLSLRGRCVELAMEMFPWTVQSILSGYIEGEISEQEFLETYEKTWGYPYSLYRDLINWQKAKRMPLIGINAPNDVVKKIGRNGLESLTPDERSLVAGEFHLDDPPNRARVEAEYSFHHKGQIKDFDSFFEAQLAWEETMAENLVLQLKGKRPDCIILVVLGKGHISERLGVPYLTRLRTPHEAKTVAPVPIDYPLSTSDPGMADYIIITKPWGRAGA
jgi:uncharacterized iron-regulated protein